MIEKKQILNYNDGSGLFDTAGILRSAIEDINALNLQGVQNWARVINAVQKIESAIHAVKRRDEEDEKQLEEQLEKQAEEINAQTKIIEFTKGGDVPHGDV